MRLLRSIKPQEWGDAMQLVWRVFLRFEADTYTGEGIENFYRFITDDVLYMMYKQGEYRVFGCFEDDTNTILGVISVRKKNMAALNHISLLFVDTPWHHQGIASALMRYLCDYLLEYEKQTFVTVNAAPYAVGFYRKMGFIQTEPEQTADGITFVPMKFFL